MQHRATQHEVPQNLRDRHPYDSEQHVDTFDLNKPRVRHAYGERAAPKLLDVLANLEAADEEVLDALAILIKNGSNQENATKMINDGAVEVAMDALSHENPQIRAAVAKLFTHLSKHWSARERMAERSTIAVLARLCGEDEPEVEVQQNCAMALAAYCQTIDGWQFLAENEAVFPQLAHALQFNPSTIHPLAYATSHFKDGASVFIRNGGVSHLVALAKRLTDEWEERLVTENSSRQMCSISFDELTDTVATMRGVAVDDSGKSELVSEGAVPILISLHRHHNASVRMPVSGTFPLLAAVELSSLTAFCDCGSVGVRTLVSSLTDSSHEIRRNVRTAISYLSANSDNKQRFVFELILQGHVGELIEVYGGSACDGVCVCLSFPGAHKIRKKALEVIHRLTESKKEIDSVANALHILPRLIGAIVAASDGGSVPAVGTPTVSVAETTRFSVEEYQQDSHISEVADFSSEVDQAMAAQGCEALYRLCAQFGDCRDTVINVLRTNASDEHEEEQAVASRFTNVATLHSQLCKLLEI
eukprot:gb/GECG01013868.1/.p1 GENE.gb/GECG01013868.1/~~gb/GECG01013868.1/.p1  ORF type:complete len:533 (+),score=70.01 gb/GECG01013868.1/:1-1599(+)